MDLERLYYFIKDNTGSNQLKDTIHKTEWIQRCPYCGDSRNQQKGHLYINKELFLYHCFKCESKGSVKSLLQDLSFTDKSVLDEIKVLQKNYISQTKNYNVLQSRIYKYTGIGYKNIDDKLNYLKSRLGDDFITKENVETFRIVPSIKQFIEFNNIAGHKIDSDKMKWLDEKFVGFVCYRGAKIVLRCIEPSPKLRYYVGKFFDELDVYSIPTTTSQYEALKRNKIVLAEGPFDIIKSYTTNVLNLKDTSSIFISVLSKAYVGAHWLTRGLFALPAPDTVLLLDNDMIISKRTQNLLVTNNITKYKNGKGKDFGSESICPIIV